MKLEQILSPASMGMLNAYAELCMTICMDKGELSGRVGLIITKPFPMVDSRTMEQWHAVLTRNPDSLPKDVEATVIAVGGVVVPGITPQTYRQWELDNNKSISAHPTAIPACAFVVKLQGGACFYATPRLEDNRFPEPQWSTSTPEHIYDCPMWGGHDE